MSSESIVSGNVARLAASLAAGDVRVVDMTARLSEATPVLPLPEPMAPIPGFRLIEQAKYDHRGETSYQNEIRTGEHVGTHFDAPCHWITGQARGDVAMVPVGRLVAPAVVLDRTAQAAENPDFLLEVADLEAWEREHGPFPVGCWLLYRTGWSARSADLASFLNADADGPHTPGLSPACAQWLAQHPAIVGIGVETVGTDAGQAFGFDPPFPAHAFMLGAGKYGLTQLQNMAELPTTGSLLIVAPLPIIGGSGSPARVMALIESA